MRLLFLIMALTLAVGPLPAVAQPAPRAPAATSADCHGTLPDDHHRPAAKIDHHACLGCAIPLPCSFSAVKPLLPEVAPVASLPVFGPGVALAVEPPPPRNLI